MEYALQKPWLIGSTTRRIAEMRDSLSTPSSSVASSPLKLGYILFLNWTFYLLVTNFTCPFNSVHSNYLKLSIKQAQTLLTICRLRYIFLCNCLLQHQLLRIYYWCILGSALQSFNYSHPAIIT